VKNGLSYYGTELITAVISFAAQAQGEERRPVPVVYDDKI